MSDKKPKIGRAVKIACERVIHCEMKVRALTFAMRNPQGHWRGADKRVDEAYGVVFSHLYQDHRDAVQTLLHMLIADQDWEAAKAITRDGVRDGVQVMHLLTPGHVSPGGYLASEEEEFRRELEEALVAG